MTEIKSGSEFTASRALLEKMREFASNGKNADGSVDLSKNQITTDEIDQLKSLASIDTAGLTEDERKLIDGLNSASQNDTATVEHNIAELNKDLKAANQVDFEAMKFQTQSTSFFGLFRSTSENSVKLSDSHIPSVQNPNTNVSMQERSTLEQENLKTMMEPFENALNAQPPSQEIMERMALMVDPPLDLKSSPNMTEEQSKLMREAAQQRIEQLKTDPELQKATLAKVAEMKEKIAAYKQNPTEAFRPMYESYCQLATGYAVLPPAENSLFSKGYIAALNGANYNVLETNTQALDHKAAIQNGDFITPPTIEQINQTQQGLNQSARDKIMPMLADSSDLISKLDELKKTDPTTYDDIMQGFGTEDLDVLKVRLQELKQYMDAQPPNPITQAQMSQMSYIEGSLIRLQYQTKLESLKTSNTQPALTTEQRAASREQILKEQAAAQAVLDDPASSPEAKAEASGNLQMFPSMLAELDQVTNPPNPALESLSNSFQKLFGKNNDSKSFVVARDEVRNAVSKQSQTIAELEHVEQSITNLMTRSDLNLENRKSLESKLAAIQQAKTALMQGQPVDIQDPVQKAAFDQVLGLLNQVRSSNQPDLLAPVEGYGDLFTDANTDEQAFAYDPMCFFDLDYDFSNPFSMDELFGGSNQKVQDLLLDDLKTRQSNLGSSESIDASNSIPETVSAENRQLYQSLLTVRNSPGVDDKTKACINVALEQLSDPSLKPDGPEIQTIKQVAATYDQLKRTYGSNAANLAFINAVQNLFPGDKTPSSLEVKQMLAKPEFNQKLQSAINSFINDDKFIDQAQKLKNLSAEEYEYDNLTELLNRTVPGQSHPLNDIVQKLKADNVPWDDSLSVAQNIQKLPAETLNKYFKNPQTLQELTLAFENNKPRMAELERKSQSLSGQGLTTDERAELIGYQQTSLQIAQLKALNKFEATSKTVMEQRQAQIPVLNSTIGNLTSQLTELRARRPPVDPRILGPIEAQLRLLTDAKAKLDAGGTLDTDDIGNIALASALSDANTRILKFAQLNPDNPAVQALYNEYVEMLTRRHQFSSQDLTELLGRFESVPGVVPPTDAEGTVSSFNFEERADAAFEELGGITAPVGPSGMFAPSAAEPGAAPGSGGVDFSRIPLSPESGPLADLIKSFGEQNNYINSLSGEERRRAFDDAIEVGEIMDRAFKNFSTGKIESDEDFGRNIKDRNAFNKSQLEAAIGSKQTALIEKADQDESNLNLAPMPEVSGDEHFSQWLSETLKIIRNWDEKERKAFMAALALKMMDEVIRTFYKDQQDRSIEHHEASLTASREQSQQLIQATQDSRDFGSAGNDQAVAAMSGQGRASDRSEAFNRAAQIDPQVARQQLIGMIQSARTGDQRLHISAADEEALLAKFDTLMLAVSTPDTEDDRLAVMAMA